MAVMGNLGEEKVIQLVYNSIVGELTTMSTCILDKDKNSFVILSEREECR